MEAIYHFINRGSVLKMNVFIFGANWFNHGDESAIRAMIDEIEEKYQDIKIRIQFNQNVNVIPYKNIKIINSISRPSIKAKPLDRVRYEVFIKSGGKINLYFKNDTDNLNNLLETIKWADLAIFAPGGPTIGDIYRQYQLLDMMDLMYKNRLPYFFYAPSMGPFSYEKTHISKCLNRAKRLYLRESISKGYVESISKRKAIVTLDSAFQYQYSLTKYEEMFQNDDALQTFIKENKKIIGITITDLQWHSSYVNGNYKTIIDNTFLDFANEITRRGYGLLFIPQLFGDCHDDYYMKQFMTNKSFMLNENYDCYFQQHIISKLYAVIGMRYHSNIFSAKVGTPFVSISYEQKMKGFMSHAGLMDYCIDINDLSYDRLLKTFDHLVLNYDSLKKELGENRKRFMAESHRTTESLFEVLEEIKTK